MMIKINSIVIMAPPKGSRLSWHELADVQSNILTRVVFTHRLIPELGDVENTFRLEKMVGELLQAAATNVLHASAGPQDLRVERAYVVKTKNGPPRKARSVANLYTQQAIQLLEGIPVSDNNQVKTPQGDLLHLHGPDRTRAEAHLITNVPSGIKLSPL